MNNDQMWKEKKLTVPTGEAWGNELERGRLKPVEAGLE